VSLLTYARYVQLTGDVSTAVTAVEAALVDSEREVARVLRRPLEYGVHTEQVTVHEHGRAYPRAVPVTSIPASATYIQEDTTTLHWVTRDDTSLSPVGPADFQEWGDSGWTSGYPSLYGLATIVYSGGWTLDDSPAGTRVPYPVERAIALVAKGMTTPGGFTVNQAANIQSAALGGVSVTYRDNESSGGLDDFWPGATKSIMGFRYRDGVGP